MVVVGYFLVPNHVSVVTKQGTRRNIIQCFIWLNNIVGLQLLINPSLSTCVHKPLQAYYRLWSHSHKGFHSITTVGFKNLRDSTFNHLKNKNSQGATTSILPTYSLFLSGVILCNVLTQDPICHSSFVIPSKMSTCMLATQDLAM